ncbi:MAG: thioredoxin family protein [Bacteroidia bacterium]|nr:thioredoxin family protein [Bacteroidia bacterium]
MIKKILFAIFFFAFLHLQSQIINPEWKVTFSKAAVKTGDELEVIFTASVPKNWHMYSTSFSPDCGPIPLDILLKPDPSYKMIGSLKSIGDIKEIDKIFNCEVSLFHNKAEIRQKIKILGNNLKLKGEIEGQWCEEDQCRNFSVALIIPSLKISGESIGIPETPIPVLDTSKTIPVVTPDTSAIIASSAPTTVNQSYKLTGSEASGNCVVKTFKGGAAKTEDYSYWGFFIIAFLSGLTALLTPCVFPMIPMTVSFFMTDKEIKRKGIFDALIYGVSIVAIYTLIGTLVAVLFGSDAANWVSTHWIPNVFFFLIFLVFAASFFGAFEISLPGWLVNKVDKQADKGGLLGPFFMAFTLVLVSFSCTGPIVGSILVASVGGEYIKPLIGMLGFSLAFAIPFTLFALFPHWLNKLPKSGGWLNSVKVCLGFIELAFGLKFLSTADQTYHWGILDREVYLVLWIVIFFLMGVYLLGKLKFSHDSDLPYIKVPRLILAICTFSFVMYMIPGLWGAPLKGLAGYLPPIHSQDFNLGPHEVKGNICEPAKYGDKLHVPQNIAGYFDYEQGIACAKKLNKPVFLDFTGHGCVNCRKMEESVWADPAVLKILTEDYVVISLYVDDKVVKLDPSEYFTARHDGKEVTTLGKKNTAIQQCMFGTNSQPEYITLDLDQEMLSNPTFANFDSDNIEKFIEFLEAGKKEFNARHKK